MVWVAFAKEGPLLPKEEGHWRVLSVVGFATVRGGLSSARDAPRLDIVVRIAADHDGVVPRCPSGGAVVRVAADDDGVVPRRPSEGTIVASVVLDVADDGALVGHRRWRSWRGDRSSAHSRAGQKL